MCSRYNHVQTARAARRRRSEARDHICPAFSWHVGTSHLTLHTSKYALKLRTFTSAELCGWVVRPVLSASRLPAAALPGLHY